jgi:Citrate lyase beta subunit
MTLLWRSLQYVPAHVEKYVRSTHIHDADGVILDLEDSVPNDQKAVARGQLNAATEVVSTFGADVLIRINDGMELAGLDIAAAVRPGVRALVIPKIRDAAHVEQIDALVSRAEADNGVPSGAIGLLLLIETAAAYLKMSAIADASPRTVALNLGAEDFALDVGMVPSEETLAGPRQQVVIAAAAAGVMPLGLMGAGADFGDLDAYRLLAERSRRFGFCGSSCIHPSQIPILNAAFSPKPEELAWAERVLAAAVQAQREGRDAFSLDGRMIDRPVAARARQIVDRNTLINNKKNRPTT